MILLDIIANVLIAVVAVNFVEWACRVHYGARGMYSARASADTSSGEWRIYVHVRNHSAVPMRFTLSSAYTQVVDGGVVRNFDYRGDDSSTYEYEHIVPALGELKLRTGYGAVTPLHPPACGLVSLRGTLAYFGSAGCDVVEDLPFYYTGKAQ